MTFLQTYDCLDSTSLVGSREMSPPPALIIDAFRGVNYAGVLGLPPKSLTPWKLFELRNGLPSDGEAAFLILYSIFSIRAPLLLCYRDEAIDMLFAAY